MCIYTCIGVIAFNEELNHMQCIPSEWHVVTNAHPSCSVNGWRTHRCRSSKNINLTFTFVLWVCNLYTLYMYMYRLSG